MEVEQINNYISVDDTATTVVHLISMWNKIDLHVSAKLNSITSINLSYSFAMTS